MFSQEIDSIIDGSSRVLIAGAGGGYDVICGLPIFVDLHKRGKEVHLASLSSTPINDVQDSVSHLPNLLEITCRSSRPSYFPEGWLARWIEADLKVDRPIWCFGATGVQPLVNAYQYLIDLLAIDTIIVVDGGVDSLLRGDEFSLASPLEDALTLAAASSLEGVKIVLACTAFGAERLDSIQHAQVLGRIADLSRQSALFGVYGLQSDSDIGQKFVAAAEYILANQADMHQSVVVSCLLSALRGDFGDQAVNEYTVNSPPWVSPLMPLYWFFDLPTVAASNLYLPRLYNTETFSEAAEALGSFVRTRTKRGLEPIPI